MRRADRRRRLLAMGMSLDEQSRTPLYEISQLLAVDDVYREHEKAETEKAKRQSKSPGRGKLGGGRG